VGEHQHTANFYRAFTDYVNRFTFGKGIHFETAEETSGILPDLLHRVWTKDNNKESVLLEMGQQGSVSGDCFVKVAYEEPRYDDIGVFVPGKVRILPLNAAHCFPEWHPHDRTRMLRCKVKYRFWGTSLEGTRQVFTYTEILTDNTIEEYLNDELIDSRPNPIGMVPIVHIANLPVSGSPWGLPDCQDIIGLNRQYNEISTALADIINYHAEPITIITGAKASQLERGAKKIWAGLPKDARVENLEGGYQGLQQGVQYLEILKRTMHEMVGVPETALGQVQSISNTSGVALSIQFQPLMNRWEQKTTQYGYGIQRINELVIRTIAVKEPDMLIWNPELNSPLEGDHLPQLDPSNPITYYSEAQWPPPLPLDKLVLLNEIQAKFQLGLESREGALRLLGEEFPDEKLIEIRDELIEDALADGALGLVKAQVAIALAEMTGMTVTPDGMVMPAPPPEPIDTTGDGIPDQMSGYGAPPTTPEAAAADAEIRNRLLTMAYGTKIGGATVKTESSD
jgi:cell division protein FtsI/penicillin-binding protein 2